MTATREAAGPLHTEGRPGLVLSAIGPDRPGLVKDIAGHIRKLGGNIEDTRMSKLGGEFAVLVLVTGESGPLAALKDSFPQMESAWGVSCFVKDTAAGPPDVSGAAYSFRASGLDHPGIVEAVTDVLAKRKANVTSFSSWIENAPLTGTPVFHLDAEVHLPVGTEASDLRASLTETCEREGVEFQLTELAR